LVLKSSYRYRFDVNLMTHFLLDNIYFLKMKFFKKYFLFTNTFCTYCILIVASKNCVICLRIFILTLFFYDSCDTVCIVMSRAAFLYIFLNSQKDTRYNTKRCILHILTEYSLARLIIHKRIEMTIMYHGTDISNGSFI